VRASLSALTFYQFSVSHLGTQASAGLVKWLNGSSKSLGVAGYTFTPQVGDVFRLSVVTGSDGFPVLSVYQNGFLLYEVQDYVSPITSGAPGFYFYATDAIAQTQISKWAGGNANVIPNYPSGSAQFIPPLAELHTTIPFPGPLLGKPDNEVIFNFPDDGLGSSGTIIGTSQFDPKVKAIPNDASGNVIAWKNPA
jgi:hypothetical protein